MATVEVAFVALANGVIDSAGFSSTQVITSSASNQVSTAGAANGDSALITATGGNVYIAFGASPDATVAATRRLVLDGTSRPFAVPTGHKVAVVDA